MSKKELLNETQIRRFMKLANLEPLSKNVLSEMAQSEEERKHDVGDRQGALAKSEGTVKEEMGVMQDEADMGGMKEAEDAAEAPETEEAPEAETAGGGEAELMALITALKAVLKPELADKLDVESSGEGEGEEEMNMDDVSMDGEGEEEGEEEEGEEDEEQQDEAKSLSEDELVETVLARVTARLVAEAKKKKPAAKSAKEKMKMKAKEKMDAKKEKDVVEEALDGVNLAEKGKEQKNVYKGHADMTMAKGEKGGKGGHEMETLSAKAGHTVTHGGTNLATKGGNKKK
jgi:hypothetical protein